MSLESNCAKLPAFCAALHPNTKEPVLLKRGETGYWPTEGLDPRSFNEARGVTPRQVRAMLLGSIWGFEVKGADPDSDIHDTERDVYDPTPAP